MKLLLREHKKREIYFDDIAGEQNVGADEAACHGPCYLTQASFWSEDPTSNEQLRHNEGEQGPRQTAARYLPAR